MELSSHKTSAVHLINLCRALEQVDVSREQFLQASNIDREGFGKGVTISLSTYLDAVRIALELAPRPDLGFLVGKRTGLLGAGMLGYALLCCATLRDSLNRYLELQRLLAPGLRIDLIHDEDQTCLTAQPAAPNISRDRDLLNYLTGQWLAGWNDWSSMWGTPAGLFHRIELGHNINGRSHTYTGLIGRPVFSAGDTTKGIFASQYLEHRPHCDQRLLRLIGDDCLCHFVGGDRPNSETVYRQLVFTPGHMPTMEEMAFKLNTSVRTLRRRLQKEDTTYQGLVINFRQCMAKQYLKSTSLPVNEIACLVGYADTANFYRLFRDTTGMTPQSFRQLSWDGRAASAQPRCRRANPSPVSC